MHSTSFTLVLLASLYSCRLLASNYCQEWSKAYQVGELDPQIINEASGLEWDKDFPQVLFHINDSGSGPYIHQTQRDGSYINKTKIKSLFSWDSEDVTIGLCPGQSSERCFYYGDIGDNDFLRSKPKITIVALKDLMGQKLTYPKITKIHTLNANLETGNTDMEGMAMHPSGDLYLATKDDELTRIMRIKKEDLLKNTANAKIVATVDFSKIDPSLNKALVTGMDIADDGQSFLLLTYEHVFDMHFDLSTLVNDQEPLELSAKAHKIEVPILPQQESIAYIENGSFLYTSEDGQDPAPLMRLDCLKK